MVVTSSRDFRCLGWVARPPSLVVVGGGELVTRYDPDEVACFRAKL